MGTLHEINPEASTIALENVASFGTEGRRGNPAEEIPPSASVYEYIVFRGSDVKDISVAEEKDTAPPEPPQVPDDPAILGVSQCFVSISVDSSRIKSPDSGRARSHDEIYSDVNSQTCSECAKTMWIFPLPSF